MNTKELKIIKENKLLEYPLLREKLFKKFFPHLDFKQHYYSTFWFNLVIQEYPQIYQKPTESKTVKKAYGEKDLYGDVVGPVG